MQAIHERSSTSLTAGSWFCGQVEGCAFPCAPPLRTRAYVYQPTTCMNLHPWHTKRLQPIHGQGTFFNRSKSRESMKRLQKGCGYRGFEFGARSYPDSVCCGGRLYDTDDFEDRMEEIPCPNCRENEAIEYWFDHFALGGEGLLSARHAAESHVARVRQSRVFEIQQRNTEERKLQR